MARKPDPELIDHDSPEAGPKWFANAPQTAELLREMFGESDATELLKPPPVRPAPVTTDKAAKATLNDL